MVAEAGVVSIAAVSRVAEIADLEDELRDDPRQQKLEHLRAVLALYEQPQHHLRGQGLTVRRPGIARPRLTVNATLTADATVLRKEDAIRAELKEFLRARGGGKVHRSLILQHLIEKGLMGREKDPMANLAAYMSNFKDEFASDGAGHWSLRQQPERADAG
jgi:hypothetical protein